MPGWHRVFSNSSLDVTMPQDDVRGLAVIATHRGHLPQWLYGGTEGCQQVTFAIRISLRARSKHLLMCDGVWWFAVPWTRWWRERHGMTLLCSDKTLSLFVKNCLWMLWRAVSDCPPGFMTGTNCNSHDVIYLKRRTFFRNSPQYCTGTKKTNIEWAFSLLTQLVVA